MKVLYFCAAILLLWTSCTEARPQEHEEDSQSQTLSETKHNNEEAAIRTKNEDDLAKDKKKAAPVIKKASCERCRAPKFQGIDFYLPFCSTDDNGTQLTHPNLCGAICVNGTFTKGSCDQCEAKCNNVFLPVCLPDQSRLFANRCHARCAGYSAKEDTVDCDIKMVIPGRTKLPPRLPPNVKPPKVLQTGGHTDEEEI